MTFERNPSRHIGDKCSSQAQIVNEKRLLALALDLIRQTQQERRVDGRVEHAVALHVDRLALSCMRYRLSPSAGILAGMERLRLRAAEVEAQRQAALFGRDISHTGIFRGAEAGMPIGPARG